MYSRVEWYSVGTIRLAFGEKSVSSSKKVGGCYIEIAKSKSNIAMLVTILLKYFMKTDLNLKNLQRLGTYIMYATSMFWRIVCNEWTQQWVKSDWGQMAQSDIFIAFVQGIYTGGLISQ